MLPLSQTTGLEVFLDPVQFLQRQLSYTVLQSEGTEQHMINLREIISKIHTSTTNSHLFPKLHRKRKGWRLKWFFYLYRPSHDNSYTSRTCSVSASSISTLRQARVSTMRARTLKGVLSSLSTYSISREPDWLRWIPSKHCKVFFSIVGCKGGDSVSKTGEQGEREWKRKGSESSEAKENVKLQ